MHYSSINCQIRHHPGPLHSLRGGKKQLLLVFYVDALYIWYPQYSRRLHTRPCYGQKQQQSKARDNPLPLRWLFKGTRCCIELALRGRGLWRRLIILFYPSKSHRSSQRRKKKDINGGTLPSFLVYNARTQTNSAAAKTLHVCIGRLSKPGIL